VLVAAIDAPVDLVRDRYDVAIRFGQGPYPGFAAKKLISLFMFPLCSPRLLAQTPLNHPRDLAKVQLFGDVNLAQAEPDWGAWLTLAGAPEVDWRGGQLFSNTYLAIEAALAGRGVALAEAALVQDELASGRLVKPFDIELLSGYSQWILSLRERPTGPTSAGSEPGWWPRRTPRACGASSDLRSPEGGLLLCRAAFDDL